MVTRANLNHTLASTRLVKTKLNHTEGVSVAEAKKKQNRQAHVSQTQSGKI